jgi:hypothetical protein
MIVPFMIVILATAVPGQLVAEWARFEKSVRDQAIRKEDARKQFPAIYEGVKAICREYPFKPVSPWHFPLQGYGAKDMGAGGFQPDIRYGSSQIKGYDFLKEVLAGAGAFCKAGSVIGTVGRSGKNAWRSRSPTHLHFMVLHVTGNTLTPLDYREYLGK